MSLLNVQTDAIYRELVDEVLDELRPGSSGSDPGMCYRGGWIFVTSPKAVTPFHIDKEHNFILQMRGTKNLYVWDHRDTEVISEQARDRFHFVTRAISSSGSDEFRSARVFELQPGQGAYMPSTSPHMVENDDDPSITVSFTYYTDATRRNSRLHALHQSMREAGMSPAPVGHARRRDAVVGSLTAVGTSVRDTVARLRSTTRASTARATRTRRSDESCGREPAAKRRATTLAAVCAPGRHAPRLSQSARIHAREHRSPILRLAPDPRASCCAPGAYGRRAHRRRPRRLVRDGTDGVVVLRRRERAARRCSSGARRSAPAAGAAVESTRLDESTLAALGELLVRTSRAFESGSQPLAISRCWMRRARAGTAWPSRAAASPSLPRRDGACTVLRAGAANSRRHGHRSGASR